MNRSHTTLLSHSYVRSTDGIARRLAAHTTRGHAEFQRTLAADGNTSSVQERIVARFLGKSLYSRYARNSFVVTGLIVWSGVAILMVVCWFAMTWKMGSRLHMQEEIEDGFASEDSCSETVFAPQLSDQLISESTRVDIDLIQPAWTPQVLSSVFHQYKIDLDTCRVDQLEYLACELSEGQARLCRDKTALKRVLDIVTVILTYQQEDLVIQEVAHPEYTRDFEIAGHSMKAKLEPDENVVACAARCLNERLGVRIEGHIQINPDVLNMSELQEVDDMIPGLTSMHRVFVVEANVVSTESSFLEKIGLPRGTLLRDDYLYKWESITNVTEEQKQLRLKTSSPVAMNGVRWNVLSHSFVPVMPWTTEDVKRELKTYGIPESAPFGRSLESLLKDLQDGKIMLGAADSRQRDPEAQVDSETRRLLCVAEEVTVVLQSQRGEVLVPDDGYKILRRVSKAEACPALPSTQKFANESIWNATLRLSQMNLKLSTPIFSIEASLLCTNDVLSAKGNFVRRRFIVNGPMTPDY